MLIETRVIGRKARPLDRWAVPNPPTSGGGDGDSLTLRSLITKIVRSEVEAFEKRDRARRLVRVLSENEIAVGVDKGKVDAGGRPPGERVDVNAAIAAALQGFVDGLYLTILDGVEQRDLDSPVYLNPESKLVFLRLTFLAGA
jgi:hypothetical protein